MEVWTPTQIETRFAQLQRDWQKTWKGDDPMEAADWDILVVPSFSIDQSVGQKVPGFLFYEERLLFSLIRLRHPKTRLIYVTAQPLAPMIVDYYLQLLPGIPFSHARDRLLLLSTYDGSLQPLSRKLLDRPRLLAKIRQALRPGRSYMVCFNSTPLERELAVRLGLPLYAADPKLSYWGSKSGSREIFSLAGVPHPNGSPLVYTVADLIAVLEDFQGSQPQQRRWVVKLNEGFSGEGNALLTLPPGGEGSIAEALATMRFQGTGETWASFAPRIGDLGAIVEAFIEGDIKASPSVQGCIHPDGQVEILSTHDQILGGPDGQIYLGCRFPAEAGYRLAIQEWGRRVGEVLAAKGAIERFGVDFVAVRQGDRWAIQAIEINLRKGGTTHPFMTLKLLTNGRYDNATGQFHSPEGQSKYYFATDNLQKPHYRGLLPSDLIDIIAEHHLHFDSSTKTGTIFHLMGPLSEFGKLGLTCIGNSPEEAEAIYAQTVAALDRETQFF